MKIEYRKADIADAQVLVGIYNSAFYEDYVKYGECPAYGKTKEMMEKNPRLPETQATGITAFFIPGLKRWNPEFQDDYKTL